MIRLNHQPFLIGFNLLLHSDVIDKQTVVFWDVDDRTINFEFSEPVPANLTEFLVSLGWTAHEDNTLAFGTAVDNN